jgi:hypothetical protein
MRLENYILLSQDIHDQRKVDSALRELVRIFFQVALRRHLENATLYTPGRLITETLPGIN